MRETALVTGGSTLIVQAFCREWARPGRKFIFLGRSEERLQTFRHELLQSGCESNFISCDLTTSTQIHLDSELSYIIHGASTGLKDLFQNSSLETLLSVHHLNSSALISLMKIALPRLRESGKVLMLSSTAAFHPGPGNAVYFADKAFQNSLTQALAFEYRSKKIKFLLLCAGPLIEQKHWNSELKRSGFMRKLRLTQLEKVASRIEARFEGEKIVWIPGMGNKFIHHLTRVLPKNFIQKMTLEMSLSQK